MEFKLLDSGLFCLMDDRHHRVGGRIRVLARTRLPDRRHGHGALIEWLNHDGQVLQEVIYARDLHGDRSRQIRDMLIDSGYDLAPGHASWGRLQHHLLQEMTKAAPATVVDRTGWHGKVFATPGWTEGQADERYYYVGQLSRESLFTESGDLCDWKIHIGEKCRGNPLAVFVVGVALAAPLLASAGMENGAYHLVGTSSAGKTTLLQLACSVYGSSQFMRSWISTANGLAAVSAEHNDALLAIDEIGLARAEDVDVAIYQLMNGVGKIRANILGELINPSHWRTLVLSSGEVWISEILEQIGKPLKAGQQTRLVEIPIFGKFGAFEQLHGSRNSREFVDELKAACKKYHGVLFRRWISLLANKNEELTGYLLSDIERLSSLWVSENMDSQVHRVVRRFSLIAAALCFASKNHLIPWSEEESVASVRRALDAWLATRGHIFNYEEYRILQQLYNLVEKPGGRIALNADCFSKNHVAFERDVDGEIQWLFPKERFLQYFRFPTRYMREVEPLLQKGFLDTNERSRGTLRLMINNHYRRFFALWPHRITAYLQRVTDIEEMSQFPTCPTRDTEVQNHE
ncbi:DUF927 domain-containing protein [Oceanimonas smirnovii]|uniref:DUF927 domain-containing protein n=1 Tax=Oceanimonas smirnovii TaxID=264574 RepID=UPI00376F55B6